MATQAAGHPSRLEAAQSLGFIVGVCVCLMLSLAFTAGARRRAAGPRQPAPAERINPNDAPAASLARLPGIGPTRARAIVTLRNHLQDRAGRRPVFRRAEDLGQVKGIGPVTIDGMRPWLQFDPPSGDDENLLRK